jgi:hypothetical protein
MRKTRVPALPVSRRFPQYLQKRLDLSRCRKPLPKTGPMPFVGRCWSLHDEMRPYNNLKNQAEYASHDQKADDKNDRKDPKNDFHGAPPSYVVELQGGIAGIRDCQKKTKCGIGKI